MALAKAMILPLICLLATAFFAALAYGQTATTIATPSTVDNITTREVMAIAITIIGSLLTVTVAIYSGYQTKQIHRAQSTGDQAMAKALEVEKTMLQHYDTSTRTARMMEQAMAPLRRDVEAMTTSVNKMSEQFVSALIQIKGGGV